MQSSSLGSRLVRTSAQLSIACPQLGTLFLLYRAVLVSALLWRPFIVPPYFVLPGRLHSFLKERSVARGEWRGLVGGNNPVATPERIATHECECN